MTVCVLSFRLYVYFDCSMNDFFEKIIGAIFMDESDTHSRDKLESVHDVKQSCLHQRKKSAIATTSFLPIVEK